MDFHREWMKRRKDLEDRMYRSIKNYESKHSKTAPAVACKAGRSGEQAYTPIDIPVTLLLEINLFGKKNESGDNMHAGTR